MFPRMGEKILDWPDSDEEVRGEELKALRLDDVIVNMDSKLKTLQKWCEKLGLATSGEKTKCLKRLQNFQIVQKHKIAVDLSKQMLLESQRVAMPLSVPKLPLRNSTISHISHLLHGANAVLPQEPRRIRGELPKGVM